MTTEARAEPHRTLRDTLGRYATGVTVVTTARRDQAVGLTVNSFTSLSLAPPLVLWCLRRKSPTRAAFTTSPLFAVNVLAAHQQTMATQFAGPGERFLGVALRPNPYGLPLLEGTVGTLVCRRTRVVPAGDHVMIIGAVVDHRACPGPPLLFVDGTYQAGTGS
jgi:unspecific monooxygenase